MGDFIRVLSKHDLAPGECTEVEVNGKEVALFNVDGTFYALDNTCAHEGGPLGDGDLEGKTVTCPWHSYEFDVTTGQCLTKSGLKVEPYRVKVEGDDVLVAA